MSIIDKIKQKKVHITDLIGKIKLNKLSQKKES